LRRINLAEFATSTKIEALVQELIQMRKTNPGSKGKRVHGVYLFHFYSGRTT